VTRDEVLVHILNKILLPLNHNDNVTGNRTFDCAIVDNMNQDATSTSCAHVKYNLSMTFKETYVLEAVEDSEVLSNSNLKQNQSGKEVLS